MSSPSHERLLKTAVLLFLLNLFLGAGFTNSRPLSAPEGMLMEDKIRLGSTPPSCHNQCNGCSPCTAVQVPTLPGQGKRLVRPSFEDSPFNMYSNYKPLGWKCRCHDQLYNP